ncbi:TrmB family transcriptional regulator [Papillibacter cinnamivorans]|uniref:Sugar-specific transcriptional regulator TrmB n=1 Tax=Papillibacter cinnamivorans DSM 12816 TaxID=1122930 RepID=A0A1W1ZJV9_9FIRM|nr:TrmB family transcriptional regulator [Papillibacter cinnamivorans]SMC48674.1 Sugar-specific transcriptional regulator TrmB [Papillibacter cinnamivorans DSM 12816]
MESVEMLMQFGLTRQEALIYITLTAEGALSGYEAAKLTGISRSNAYGALAELVAKGAAYVVEDTALRYSPVPVREFCRNKIHRMQELMKALSKDLPERQSDSGGYVTITGDRHIMDKARNMLRACEARVYLSAAGEPLRQLQPELEALIRAGCKVVVITGAPFELVGATVHHAEKRPDQIGLIVDSSSVLTGELGQKEASSCLYSKRKNLVDLFKTALKNEISLIELRKGTAEG